MFWAMADLSQEPGSKTHPAPVPYGSVLVSQTVS